jgi:hypothetical protein
MDERARGTPLAHPSLADDQIAAAERPRKNTAAGTK